MDGFAVVVVVVTSVVMSDDLRAWFALIGQIVADIVAMITDSDAHLSASKEDALCSACVTVDHNCREVSVVVDCLSVEGRQAVVITTVTAADVVVSISLSGGCNNLTLSQDVDFNVSASSGGDLHFDFNRCALVDTEFVEDKSTSN